MHTKVDVRVSLETELNVKNLSKFWRLCKSRNRTNTTGCLLDMNYYQDDQLSKFLNVSVICDWGTKLTCTKIPPWCFSSGVSSPQQFRFSSGRIEFREPLKLEEILQVSRKEQELSKYTALCCRHELLWAFRRSVVRFSQCFSDFCLRLVVNKPDLHGYFSSEISWPQQFKLSWDSWTVASSSWTSGR